MPLPLPHITHKLHRATEHILKVQKGIDKIIRSIPNPVVPQNDPHAVAELKEALGRLRIPDPLQIIAGEAVHQSRSALDHFAAQLAGSDWHRGTEFPIQIHRPVKPDEIGRFERKIKGFSPAAQTLIKEMQPYHLAAAKRNDYLLTILKHLNNRDKHRALLTTAIVPKPLLEYRLEGGLHVEFMPDDDADPAARPFDSIVDVYRQFSAAVVFPEFGSAKNYPVVQGLTHLRTLVGAVIGEFRSLA